MPEVINIQGIKLTLPNRPRKKDTLFGSLPKKKQMWERIPIPEFMDDYDPFGATEEQVSYIEEELNRIIDGIWIYVNGTPTFLTGANYFFLQWWKLDTGEYPQYRDIDQEFFLFWEAAKQYPRCLGICTGKFRRQGASSRGSCIAVREAIIEQNIHCGMVSKTSKDVEGIFSNMVVYGFNSLPIFLRPQQQGTNRSKTSLVIATQSERITKDKRISNDFMGLNNRIDYRGTSTNSYDSSRLHYFFGDEFGKFPPEVNAYKYWQIVRRCLVIGAKRVGMAYIPSTVNRKNEGGEAFKQLWVASDQTSKEFNGVTPSGLFKFFIPAFKGHVGYIGKYGESIIDTPTEEQTEYLKTVPECPDPYIGAKEFQEQERERLKDDQVALIQHIIQAPFNEKEMFYESATDSIINSLQANEQLDKIDGLNIPFRTGSFFRNTKTNNVEWMDSPDGPWTFLWGLGNEFVSNKWTKKFNKKSPVNTHLFAIGVDPVSSSQGAAYGKGSEGVAWVKRSYVPTDEENSDMPIGRLNYRPVLKSMFHEQVFLAAEYFSCLAGYEQTIDDFFDYAKDNGYDNYMVKTPDPLLGQRAKIRKAGIPATSKKSIEYHTNCLKSDWVQNWKKYYFSDLIEDELAFDPADRTEFDKTMAWGYALITEQACTANIIEEETTTYKLPLKTYNLTKSVSYSGTGW